MKSFYIKAKTLPEAWEKATIEVYNNGNEFKTQYDKAGNPPSKDCTMFIHIEDPMAEPRIHRGFLVGLIL